MATGFHLPHNAIIPAEFFFILSILDVNQDYYMYEDLKAIILVEEIVQKKFQIFHPTMYRNIQKNHILNDIYSKIEQRQANYDDIKNIKYTANKTFNGVWNEQARDYTELLAFIGLMPSYYKGKGLNNTGEKRHYIGFTFKDWRNNKISKQQLLLKMKFRNASKNDEVIGEYDVRNRPFVVALRTLESLKQKGFKMISGVNLSYIVRNIVDEDDFERFSELIELINDPIDHSLFTEQVKRELSRGSTFLKQYLVEVFGIELITEGVGNKTVYDLKSFNYDTYQIKEKSIYLGDVIEDLEITPELLFYLSNPHKIKNELFMKTLSLNGIIKDGKVIVDFNIDTDLQSRLLAEQCKNNKDITLDREYTKKVVIDEIYERGFEISRKSDGTMYENFLFMILQQKFSEDKVFHLGAEKIGQRLSDIYYFTEIIGDNGEKEIILNIVEAKAGNAIKGLDERKEIDNLINVLSELKSNNMKYDGVWVHIVNGDSIPRNGLSKHGGYRQSSSYQFSFEEKLMKIHKAVLNQVWKPLLVTAFSYSQYYAFLENIEYQKDRPITKIYAPHYWMWSEKFMKLSYVSVIA